jgi:hypothetical protein
LERLHDRRPARTRASLAVEAALTLVAMLFALLALDDITTDNSTGFRPEYTLLAFAGAWLLVFVIQLWRKGRPLLAAISLFALLAAAWVASDGLGHVRDGGWSVFWPEYSVTVIAWLWFAVLAAALLGQAFRRAGSEPVSC